METSLVRREIAIQVPGAALRGSLVVPERAGGVVVFAHGSGSGRHSPRNAVVAEVLNDVGLATFLFDLLTPEEALDRTNVFDVPLLAGRLGETTRQLAQDSDLRRVPTGFFGASTGAAAAFWAAAEDATVAAIVSRGGRPDLALSRLAEVHAPSLLVVGGRDRAVLELNETALAALAGPAELRIVEGATHLFEEPGALAEVARLAGEWFLRYLGRERKSCLS